MLLLLKAYDGMYDPLLEHSLAGSRLPDLVVSNLASLTSVTARLMGADWDWVSAAGDAGEPADVLLLDADVWFSRQGLQQVLREVHESDGPFKLAVALGAERSSSGMSEVVGLFVPAPSASAFFAEMGRDKLGLALGPSLARLGTVELREFQIDVEERPWRLTSLTDVSMLERDILLHRAMAALAAGVRLRDPQHVAIRGDLRCGANVEIDLHVIIEGQVTLGDGVIVGAHSIIIDSVIEAGTRIKPYSLVEGAHVGSNSMVGPYGRLRPGTATGANVQVGNFVEIKDSRIGSGSRINHLSFVGDATLGENVTLGAATITCNHNRHGAVRTDVGAGAYIGSGSELVAPVVVGENATIGAGSTITNDVPPNTLALARERQVLISGWQPPVFDSDDNA